MLEFWKGEDMPLFDSNTWQWFWQFEEKPISVVKPFHGALGWDTPRGMQCVGETELARTRVKLHSVCSCRHCKLCFWMHIHRTRRVLLHKAQTRNKARKTGQRRCELVLSFNFHFQKTLNSPGGFSLRVLSTYYIAGTMLSTWPPSCAKCK